MGRPFFVSHTWAPRFAGSCQFSRLRLPLFRLARGRLLIFHSYWIMYVELVSFFGISQNWRKECKWWAGSVTSTNKRIAPTCKARNLRWNFENSFLVPNDRNFSIFHIANIGNTICIDLLMILMKYAGFLNKNYLYECRSV